MIRKILLFVSLCVLFLVIVQCERDTVNPVGADIYNKNVGTVMPPATISVNDTSYIYTVPTGNSDYLYMGTQNRRKAYAMFRFIELPDSVQIDTATFTVYINKIYGDAPADLLPDAYLLNYKFEESEFTWRDFKDLQPIDQKIAITPVDTGEDSILSFTLPPEIVQAWADTNQSALNCGFAITYDAPDTGFTVEMFSQDYVTYDNINPRLVLKAHMDDSTYTYTSTPYDLFILDPPEETGTASVLDNALGIRTLLHFSADSIPEDATVNGAFLTLYSDTTTFYPDGSESYLFKLAPVRDASWPFPDVPYDSTQILAPEIPAGSDSVTINITKYVQDWTSGIYENAGLIMLGYWEGSDIMRRTFYNSEAIESKRPRVKVFYTIPPNR